MVRDCADTGPVRPGEVLQFGAKHMRRTSVYAYESNEVQAVFEMPYYHTTLTISAASSMYPVHSMQMFCMHGIAG